MEMLDLPSQSHSKYHVKSLPHTDIAMDTEDNFATETDHHHVIQILKPKDNVTPLLKIFTFFTALGGATFGYDIGVISGAVIQLRNEFNLSTIWTEVLVSVTVGTATIGAISGGLLSDLIGRRRTVLIASATFTGGAVLMGLSTNKEVLLVGRMIVGIGIGLEAQIAPMYLGECSPSQWRGTLVQMINICVAGGTVAANIINGIFSYYRWGWRVMLGLASIPGVIQFMGFWFLPESPRWLVKHRREAEAKATLQRLLGGIEAEDEFREIQYAEEEQRCTSNSVLSRVCSSPPVLRAAFVGCGIQIVNQLAGINVIVPYSAMIMRMSGVSSDQAVTWMAVGVSGLFLVGQLITLCTVQRFNRRSIFLSHLAVVIVALLFLAISFYLMSASAPPVTYHNMQAGTCGQISQCNKCILQEHCGFCYNQQNGSMVKYSGSCLPLDINDIQYSTIGRCAKANKTEDIVWAYNYCPNPYGLMALIGMMGYILPFAAGVGPLVWIVTPELYPNWARSFGTSSATAVGWVTNLAVSLTFLSLTQAITRYGTFLLYASCTIIGWIFIYFFVPETKDKHLEDIEKLFEKPLCACKSSKSGYQKLHNSGEDHHEDHHR